jgi:hypothetical protein
METRPNSSRTLVTERCTAIAIVNQVEKLFDMDLMDEEKEGRRGGVGNPP